LSSDGNDIFRAENDVVVLIIRPSEADPGNLKVILFFGVGDCYSKTIGGISMAGICSQVCFEGCVIGMHISNALAHKSRAS
jgi:hypothetical protein